MIRPLTRATLLLAAALLLGLRVPGPPRGGFLPLIILTAAAALPAVLRWPGPGRAADGDVGAGAGLRVGGVPVQRRRAGSLALCALAGLALGAAASTRAREDCLGRIPDGARLEVRGHLTALPEQDGAVALDLVDIRTPGAAGRCEGTVRAFVGAVGWGGAEGGTEVVARGRWLARPVEGAWPRRGERAGSLVLDSVRVLRPASLLRHPAAVARSRAQQRIRALFPRHAGLVEQLILDQRGGVDPAVQERFARSGLTHLLSISGLHVGIVAGVLLLLGRLARLGARATGLLTVSLTLAYVLLLGAPHAATRAALQLGLVLLMRQLQRPSDRFTPLCAAAICILALDPLAILEAGFQLSFGGIAGLIALRRRIMTRLAFVRSRFLQDSLASSLAATVTTAPIAALHFGQFAPIGILANIVAVPLMGAAVPAVAAGLAVGAISPGAGRFLAGGAELLLDGLDTIAKAAAAVPGGSIWVPRDAVLAWGVAALVASRAAAWLIRPTAHEAGDGGGVNGAGRGVGRDAGRHAGARDGLRTSARRIVAAGMAAAILLGWPAGLWYGRAGTLEIHAIDVGQGDAYAIRSPRGRWLLVDAGPRTADFDAGRSRVAPFLLSHGVRRLEALILTHPDMDHIGGAAAVLDAVEVGAIVDPGHAAGKSMYLELLEAAGRQELQWIAARAGRTVRLDGMELQILSPEGAALDGDVEANQVSVAFRLQYGGFCAVFLGDVPGEVERRLVERHGGALRADLLKVAHHGSGSSTVDTLIAAVAPWIALISVGRHNRYGHPDPAVLARLERRGVRVLRTDRDGSVRVRVDAAGMVEVTTTR